MTTPSLKEKIRAKVIEAVPEIVELKFGCGLSDGQDVKIVIRDWKSHWECDDRTTFNGTALMHYDSGNRVLLAGRTYFILGRPIRLADILVAIEKIPMDKEDAFDIPYRWWNLHNDSLDSQSDDCLKFLAEVLGVSEGV
jgi:hypothetical protein